MVLCEHYSNKAILIYLEHSSYVKYIYSISKTASLLSFAIMQYIRVIFIFFVNINPVWACIIYYEILTTLSIAHPLFFHADYIKIKIQKLSYDLKKYFQYLWINIHTRPIIFYCYNHIASQVRAFFKVYWYLKINKYLIIIRPLTVSWMVA